MVLRKNEVLKTLRIREIILNANSTNRSNQTVFSNEYPDTWNSKLGRIDFVSPYLVKIIERRICISYESIENERRRHGYFGKC